MPSFFGAEGWGAESVGGRGGITIEVTNLNNDGAGSLRWAFITGPNATVPRTIVFRVSGTILLNSPLAMRGPNSFVTIAGQTSPNGIAIAPASGAEAWIGTEDRNPFSGVATQHIIVRHLRCRASRDGGSGDSNQWRFASFWGGPEASSEPFHDLIVDHCSFTWGQDQTLNIGDSGPVHTTTHSYNIIGEQGTAQDAASFLSGGSSNINHTFHHNYVAHSFFRNYLIAGGGVWYFSNEVRYNCDWTHNFSTPGSGISADVINHYVQRGPTFAVNNLPPLDASVSGIATSVFAAGNKVVSTTGTVTHDNNWFATRNERNGATFVQRFSPLSAQPPNPVSIQSADIGKDLVLANAGPRPLDSVDTRMLGDFGTPGNARNNANIGDLANYSLTAGNFTPTDPPDDSNNNGMSDEFEIRMGVSDSNLFEIDQGSEGFGLGFTNLEYYLGELADDFPPLGTPAEPPFVPLQVIGFIS